MAKVVFEHAERVLVTDKGEFPVAERTGTLEKKLNEFLAKAPELTEYEECKQGIELLLGVDAFQRLFPKGEDSNLDELRTYFNAARHEFNHDKRIIEEQENAESFAMVDKYTEKIKAFNAETDKVVAKSTKAVKKPKK